MRAISRRSNSLHRAANRSMPARDSTSTSRCGAVGLESEASRSAARPESLRVDCGGIVSCAHLGEAPARRLDGSRAAPLAASRAHRRSAPRSRGSPPPAPRKRQATLTTLALKSLESLVVARRQARSRICDNAHRLAQELAIDRESRLVAPRRNQRALRRRPASPCRDRGDRVVVVERRGRARRRSQTKRWCPPVVAGSVAARPSQRSAK